jgi:hypothetical protein
MQHVDAGHHLESFTGQLKSRAADACHIDFPRIGFCMSDEFRNRPSWDRRIYLHDVRHSNDGSDRCDVLFKNKVQVVVKRRAYRIGRTDKKKCIAIGFCPHAASAAMLPPAPGRFSTTNC